MGFSLRDALNTVALAPGDTRTFLQAGVRSSSSLIVVEGDAGLPSRPSGTPGAIAGSGQGRAHPVPTSSSAAPSAAVREVIGASSGGSNSNGGSSVVDSGGVIVLDDSLVEVTPKVRRKRKRGDTKSDNVSAEVVDLTFS